MPAVPADASLVMLIGARFDLTLKGEDEIETAEQVADTIDDAEARIRAEMPTSKWIYLEPDIRRADSPAGPSG